MPQTVTRAGAPFNRPTNIAVAPSGDLYVSDGYGNCRVHQFSPSGQLKRSWGTQTGSGMATAGIILGFIGCALLLIGIIVQIVNSAGAVS